MCPDVCPISLMKMSKAIRKLKRTSESKQYFKLKGVFVTVNPDIDIPVVLKEYCKVFDDNLLGLRAETSLSPNLQSMLRLFKVPAGLTDEERAVIKKYFMEK